ncbi:MAG: PAS domain-containing protein [Planctomycetota bacterium]|nr:PAS domain-containing protein [Planctomycetota bacterium]
MLADEANSRFVTLTETIQALSSEILRRKVTEQELAASERQLRQLADAMPQIVWAAGPDGRADYSNERWYEYTGLPREDGAAAGQRWLEFLHPDDVEPSLARWSAAVRSGDRYEDEFCFQDRRTGGYRWHLARALPIRDESGQVVRWFGTCTDIDDQKRAQEALEASDRRKDEFLAMLAHELRNPLAPMTTALHLLRLRTGEREDLGRPLDVLARQTQHLTKLVDDLLDVSRVTRGKIRLQPEPVDATAAVQRAVELGRPLLDARRHRLEVMLPREPLWVRADPTRLAQVLGNLLNNAAKFTDEGGRILVEVALDGQEVAFRVRDDGVGIAADLLPRLFQIFTQGDATLDRAAGGLGIGLALVRGLVELHGGRVDAQSDGPGRGSEFVVRLPRLDPPGQPLPAHDDVFALLRGLGPRRVLVVDDNLDAAASLAEVFAVSGHLVEQAHDGPSALVARATHRWAIGSHNSTPSACRRIGPMTPQKGRAKHSSRREHGAAPRIFAQQARRTCRKKGRRQFVTPPPRQAGVDTNSHAGQLLARAPTTCLWVSWASQPGP